jgi:hypothetical protein
VQSQERSNGVGSGRDRRSFERWEWQPQPASARVPDDLSFILGAAVAPGWRLIDGRTSRCLNRCAVTSLMGVSETRSASLNVSVSLPSEDRCHSVRGVSDARDVMASVLGWPWSTRLASAIPLTPDLGMTPGQLNHWTSTRGGRFVCWLVGGTNPRL